jgi:hypothetical protein
LVYALVSAFGALGVSDSDHVVTIQPVQPTLDQSLVSTAEPTTSPTTKPKPKPTTPKAAASTRTATTATKPKKPKPSASSVPVAARSVDLAQNRPVTATSHNQNYVPSNVTDSDQSTYWEGSGGFPQTLTVDLGSVTTVGRLDLALPQCCDWPSRTETIEIFASADGVKFHQIRASADYSFTSDATAHNSLSVTVPAGPARYVRLRFTANTGWPAAQLSRLRIHSS